MCGRYTAIKDPGELQKRIPFVSGGFFFTPRFNVAPTQSAAVIANDEARGSFLDEMKWGFLPVWAKAPLINAQAETLAQKPTFRKAYKERRCLVPADGFYEWRVGTGGRKQPVRFVLKSRELFCFAGLWEERIKPPAPEDSDLDETSQVERAFTIITTAANEAVRHVHNRMPVILQPEHYDWWLNTDSDLHESALAHPLNNKLEFYPVSPLVNNARHDSPKCIEPAPLI